MVKRFVIVMLAVLTMGFQAFAQNAVSGKVTDAKGEAIPGVSVLVKGTTTGTMTDLDGSYRLNVRPGATLVFSCVGFEDQEVVPGSRSVVNVTLAEDSELLDEVVYVAYGTAKKKDLTGSIATVDSKTLEVQAQGSVTRALEGQVAGLQTSSLDGQPGLDVGIRVRGIGTASANNSNALIIIDGAPAIEGTNPLASLNSKDIESITVLKDAASTALYGARGANGVILVNTKNGKAGKAKISFEGRWGVNAIGPNSDFDVIGTGNAGELYEFYWLGIYNSVYSGYAKNSGSLKGNAAASAEFASAHLFDFKGDATSFGRNGLYNRLAYSVPGMKFTPTNSGTNQSSTLSGAYLVNPDGKLNPNATLLWSGGTLHDALITSRFRQQYNVSANGGSDKMDYHLSLGYLSDPSYVATSAFRRYNARANVNAQITSWLKSGARFAYTHRKTNSLATRYGRNPGSTAENPFSRIDASTVLDNAYARDLDGSYILNAAGEKMGNVNAGSTAYNATPTLSPVGPTRNLFGQAINWVEYYKQQEDSNTYDDLNASGYVRASFLKYFTAEVNLTYNTTFNTRKRFFNTETAAARVGADLKSTIHKDKEQWTTINTQQLLNYGQDFGVHHVDAMVGHEYYQYDYELMKYGAAHSLFNDFQGYVNFIGPQTYSTYGDSWGGNLNKMAMESYFGRANYVYDEKYYVSASLRRDGSSKFKKPENRWGTFWSIGAGWRISAEPWMDGTNDWLDNLKVRASYGVLGNQNGIGMYSGYQTWTYKAAAWAGSGIATYPSMTALSKNAWSNDALTWENVHTTDAGVDFTLFGGKLSGTFDWFNKQTVNAIWNQNASYLAAGQASLAMNTAGIRSRGIELELNWQPVKTQDWDVIFSTNGTHYNTIITSVPEGTGSKALNGCWTANSDGWSLSGEGSSSGQEYLRGIGKDYFNMYLYKYAGAAGNTGVTYYGNDGKAYTGYTKGDPYAGMPLFWHTVTKAEAEAGKFGSAKEGDIINTTNTSLANRYEMGDAIPEWIGGFSTYVRFKGFDLTALFSYQIGGKFFSVDYATGEEGRYKAGADLNDAVSVSRELLNNTWTEDNQNAKFPMVIYGSEVARSGATLGSWNYTDMALFSASYFSIKNITLGYTFPRKLVNKINIDNLRIYASCDNPVLLYGHKGVDPRWSMTGGMNVGAFSYPYLSVYTFGVNIDF